MNAAKKKTRTEFTKSHASPAPDLMRLAVQSCQILHELGITGCCIGGIALQRWGQVRQTVDVDLTVSSRSGTEDKTIDLLLTRFQPRIAHAKDFALTNRVLLLQSPDGLGIDISLSALDYEERIFARSSDWPAEPYGRIRTCSAEDLVILKAFANRPQDWIDIERVIIRQHHRLNRQLILAELTPLVELKEEPQILAHLQQLFSA